jgi:signal transduction histidine kinase
VAGAALGGVTLDTDKADLVDRTLGDLVSNANKHAGPDRWMCQVTRSGGSIVIRVEDSGPGFPDSQLSQPGSSLNNLRGALEAAGGTLTRMAPHSGSGAIMVARIPEENCGPHSAR